MCVHVHECVCVCLCLCVCASQCTCRGQFAKANSFLASWEVQGWNLGCRACWQTSLPVIHIPGLGVNNLKLYIAQSLKINEWLNEWVISTTYIKCSHCRVSRRFQWASEPISYALNANAILMLSHRCLNSETAAIFQPELNHKEWWSHWWEINGSGIELESQPCAPITWALLKRRPLGIQCQLAYLVAHGSLGYSDTLPQQSKLVSSS